MSALQVVFMGTPDLAATCLSKLIESGEVDVIAAVSQPDRPKGRRLQLQPTPVKTVADQAGIPVLQPENARDASFLEALGALKPDLIAVAAYGQILPDALLDIPKHGTLNVHTSLLPRYRGAAPIQWAILNGDRETGVTIMKVVPELDAGDIISQQTTAVRDSDDAQTLHDRLAAVGAELLVRTLPDYAAGKLPPRAQPAEGVTYARKIRKEDGRINWRRSATEIWNQVRGLVPWPGAFTQVRGAETPRLLKIWKASPEKAGGEPGMVLSADDEGIVVGCGEGSLRIEELQREGGRRLATREFLRGFDMGRGTTLH